MTAFESETKKEQWLRSKLEGWSHRFAPIRSVPDAQRWGYRDRVCLAAAWEQERWRLGLRVRDEVIPIHACPVHSRRVRETVQLLAGILPPAREFPLAYLVQSGAQVVLVLKTGEMPATKWANRDLIKGLKRAGVEGLWLHLFPSVGRKIFAKNTWHLLWGEPRSRDGSGLWYAAGAFQQLIPELYNEALEEAQAFLSPAAGDSVIDLYCGAGSTLRRWVDAGARAIGVELGGEAVACAAQNAPHATVLRGTCEARIPQLNDWVKGRTPHGRMLLYANPPRTGVEPLVLRWLKETLRPQRIAYLSCSAGTLRRDLDTLTDAGYQVERITSYDFFPQTYHVETLALLSIP